MTGTVEITFTITLDQPRSGSPGDIEGRATAQGTFTGGKSGTSGFAEVAIPVDLLGGKLMVQVDGQTKSFEESLNSTHTLIRIECPHSTAITVTGTSVIPEFPVSVLIVLFAALAMVLVSQQIFRKTSNRLSQHSPQEQRLIHRTSRLFQ